jgi:anti-sigma B factor antagonist
MATMTFGISTEQREGTVVVTACGEIDIYTAPGLRAQIAEVTAPKLLLDLTEVSYIDAAGLGVIVGAVRAMREHSGSVSVRCGGHVRQMMQVTGIHRIVEMVE